MGFVSDSTLPGDGDVGPAFHGPALLVPGDA